LKIIDLKQRACNNGGSVVNLLLGVPFGKEEEFGGKASSAE